MSQIDPIDDDDVKGCEKCDDDVKGCEKCDYNFKGCEKCDDDDWCSDETAQLICRHRDETEHLICRHQGQLIGVVPALPEQLNYSDINTAPYVQQYILARLGMKATVNFTIAMMCLVYAGINIACMVVLAASDAYFDSHEYGFHMMEFWAYFLFTGLQMFALYYSPRPLPTFHNVWVVRTFLFFNTLLAFVPAVLITFDINKYEMPSHEIEYCGEIVNAALDILIFLSIWESNSDGLPGESNSLDWDKLGVALVVMSLGCSEVILYNFFSEGEKYSHVVQLTFAVISGFILFVFCVDAKMYCDKQLSWFLHNPKCKKDGCGNADLLAKTLL